MGINDHPSTIDFDAIEKDAEALDKRRADWITALRSGKYHQVKGHLYMPTYPFNPDGPKSGFCCIGVAAKELNSVSIQRSIDAGVTANYDSDYELVKSRMDMTQLHFDYLMSMNDANGDVYRPGVDKAIRKSTSPRRDFKFIARWLEILFALERMPSPNDTH